MACGPCRPMMVPKRCFISASAVSQEIRSNAPLALHAKAAAREGMLGIATHAHDPPVLDGGQHGASVGTIVRTGAQYTTLSHANLRFRQTDKPRGQSSPVRRWLPDDCSVNRSCSQAPASH